MSLLVILVLILVGIYGLIIFLLAIGVTLLPGSPDLPMAPMARVHILIPYHNEKKHLPGLLADLKGQDYPRDLFRVVFINDHSTDGSSRELASLLEGEDGFSTIDQREGIRGKKAALALGMEHAEAEWVLQVDADCRLQPEFLRHRMAFAEAGKADLIAGPVKISDDASGFRSWFEQLDLLSLVASGAGSFGLGRPLMCNGANLLYKKELYFESRSFDPKGIASGDDMFLMIGARRMGKALQYHASSTCTVRTEPTSSWKALYLQRLRWGGKSASYGLADIQVLALVVLLANLAFLSAPVLVLPHPASWPLLLGSMGLKYFLDFWLLLSMARLTKQPRIFPRYLLVSLVHPFFLVISSLGSILVGARKTGKWH